MYIYEMKKERAHLAKQIAKLQKDLELLPNQKLFITKNGKYNKWYIANGHTPVYIKKNQRELAEKLAQREITEMNLKNACQELDSMDRYMSSAVWNSKNGLPIILSFRNFLRLQKILPQTVQQMNIYKNGCRNHMNRILDIRKNLYTKRWTENVYVPSQK